METGVRTRNREKTGIFPPLMPRFLLRTWLPAVAGPAAAALVWLLPAPAGMPPAAHTVAGIAAWMAIWWLTAALPLAVTALLPLAMLPLLGTIPMERIARPYADPIVFLFMGGFFLAAAGKVRGEPIGFAEWMTVGVPIAAILLLVCWLLLTKVLFPVHGSLPGVRQLVARERAGLGPWTAGQRITVAVLALAAAAWIFREPKTIGAVTLPGLVDLVPGLSDAGIAIVAALLLFVAPIATGERRFALDWESAERIPWGVLVLFGGGLALAEAFSASGLAEWIGRQLEGLRGAPPIVVLGAVALLFVLLTELTSNTATAAMAMPVMAALGFMLPVGTPPNALAYGTGAVTSGEMAKAGVWLDLAATVVITVAVTIWAG